MARNVSAARQKTDVVVPFTSIHKIEADGVQVFLERGR